MYTSSVGRPAITGGPKQNRIMRINLWALGLTTARPAGAVEKLVTSFAQGTARTPQEVHMGAHHAQVPNDSIYANERAPPHFGGPAAFHPKRLAWPHRRVALSRQAGRWGKDLHAGGFMSKSKSSESDDHLLTRQEAADHLNVTPRFVTRCVQERRIRYVRVGRMVRIPESALAEYIQANTVKTRLE